jgi:phospholipase/carboxylesterase
VATAPYAAGPMLRTNVVSPLDAGERLLVLIHGYGADEADLAPLAPVLDPEGRFSTICPRGPIDLPNGGAAWYDRSPEGDVDPASFQHAVLELDHLVDAACAQGGLARAASLIVGFSQGGAMALALTLRETTKVAPVGVACLSGMLQTPDWLRYAWDADGWPAGATELPAVLVQHGTADPMVAVDQGRRTRDVLRGHGIEPEYHEYPMQHEIVPASVDDLRAWIDRVTLGR